MPLFSTIVSKLRNQEKESDENELSSKLSISRENKREMKAQLNLRSLRLASSEARGAFGVIAIGIALKGEQKFAVKLIQPDHPDQAYRATIWRQHVQQEAQFLSTLQHRNIVEFFGSHMVYEQAKNGEKVPRMFALKFEILDDNIEILFWGTGAQSEERTLDLLARHIGGALEYLHSRRIVHHDIKYCNVLHKTLPDIGLVFKLIDFGLAKRYIVPPADFAIERQHFVGTPIYSCKRKMNKVPFNPYKSDVYSFGVLLSQCKIGFGKGSSEMNGSECKNEILKECLRLRSHFPHSEVILDMLNDCETKRPFMQDVVPRLCNRLFV